MTDPVSSILAESLQNVLEFMCFTPVEGLADTPKEEAFPCATAAFCFRGHRSGSFWLSIPAGAAQEISSSFAGTSDLDRDQVAEVVGELANIACGSTLSRYANGGIFDLDSPSFTWITRADSSSGQFGEAERVNLQVGPDVISAGIRFETN